MFPTNQFVILSRAGIASFLSKIFRGLWVPAFVWAVVFPVQNHAQVTTAIIPDATLPTNSSVAQIAETFNITDGTSVGSNLFHSFDTFHVGAGDTANFVNPGGIDNILSRVTGGDASNIFGTLQSESSANVFFLNPSGVVFGPTAQLNVNGSFHVSTANSLRLGEGPDAGMFNAKNPAQDILVVDPPSAFGFLDDNPAGITIDQSVLQVPQGKTLLMVGGDIEIVGGPNQMLSAPGGRVSLASVALEGEVPLDLQSVVMTGPESLGTISLSDLAVIDTSGEGGGTVVIRGGSLFIDHSFIRADTTGEINGGLVDIALNKDLSVENGGTIRAKSFGNGNAGAINIATRNVSLTAGSQIDSSTSGPGQAGALTVEASQEVVIAGTSPFGANSGLFSNSFGSGEAAPLSVTTPQLTVVGGRILTNANGTGNAAPLTLEVDTLSLLNGGQVDSSTSGPRQAGALTVEASQEVVIAGTSPFGANSGLFSNSFGSGEAAPLSVTTPQLTVVGGRILTNANGTGNAAPIAIDVNTLSLMDGGQISSSTSAGGSGANLIVIASEAVTISGVSDSGFPSGLFNSAGGTGDAGEILSVSTPKLTMDGGRILSRTLGDGNAGDIDLDVGRLELTGGGQIFSGTGNFQNGVPTGTGGPGNGGNLTVTATDSIFIGGRDGRGSLSGLFSNAQFGSGHAGNLSIQTPVLEIEGRGAVLAITFAASIGDGGDLLVEVDELKVINGGEINTSTFGRGAAGNLTVRGQAGPSSKADRVSISGTDANNNPSALIANALGEGAMVGDAGEVSIVTSLLQVENEGRITSRTEGDGNAGDITLDVGRLELTGGGQIFSGTGDLEINDGIRTFRGTGGPGQGGNLKITAQETVFISGRDNNGLQSGLFSNAQFGTGDAGDLSLSTPVLEINNDGLILASSQVGSNGMGSSGDAGNLLVEVTQLAISNGGEISTSTDGSGQGGTLTVRGRGGAGTSAERISITGTPNGTRRTGLFSSTSGAGKAGSLSIFSQTLDLQDRGIIGTGSFDKGDAGEISIEAQTINLKSGAFIDSSTFGSGQGGTVEIGIEGSVNLSGTGTGLFTKSEGTGIGGDTLIRAHGNVFLEDGASVEANSLGTGNAGNIRTHGC